MPHRPFTVPVSDAATVTVTAWFFGIAGKPDLKRPIDRPLRPEDFPFRQSKMTHAGSLDLNALFDPVDQSVLHDPTRSADPEQSAIRFDRLAKKVSCLCGLSCLILLVHVGLLVCVSGSLTSLR